MKALDPEILAPALELQDELLGSTENFSPRQTLVAVSSIDKSSEHDLSPSERDSVHIVNGVTSQSWFFHSPLQYWSCSRDNILADHDIVGTVNERKNLSTSVNVTLRHSVVFSGKRFESRRLVAADALVITLLHLRDSPVGQQWERKAATLAEKVKDRWDVYPQDGHITTSTPYEFQFRPMSIQDTLTLTFAYGLAFVYFLMSLSKLRAVKSKIGLIVTVITQVMFAIMSSFTVCAIFNIDLSRIPRAAYPLVILAMSLENIFRLINAVILTSSRDSTSSRIGQAFGQTAPIALASSMQNVTILIILSRLMSPGVSGLCIFLAVAIVFDVFYLSTFFLSVLSVDVRRTELSDALAKAAMRPYHRHVTTLGGHKTWFEQVIHGKTPLSTRIAGTFVMVGFVLIAQWHFFRSDTVLHSTMSLLKDLDMSHFLGVPHESILDHINQARSPTSWLRLQDHETAHELINVIKPSAHSYVAQVYDPLVFVLKGSDRSPRSKEPTLLPAAYDFFSHQLTQFVVIVIVIVALLRLLISYLLWEDEGNKDSDSEDEDAPLLTVKSFPEGHSLDIAMLATSKDGHIVSAGLDRVTRVWHACRDDTNYAIPDGPVDDESIFPIQGMAIDDSSRWLALKSPFRVALWDLTTRVWGPSTPVDLMGQRPEAMFFAPSEGPTIPTLIMVRRNGTIVEFDGEKGTVEDYAICKSALLCAEPIVNKGQSSMFPHCYWLSLSDSVPGKSLLPRRISVVTASRHGCDNKPGCIHVATRIETDWDSREVELTPLGFNKPHQLLGLPELGIFIVATASQVYIFNVESLEMLHMIETEVMKPRSLQCAYSFQRLYIDTPGITTSTISYVGLQTGDCVMHTFVPPEDVDAICLRSGSEGLLDDEGCSWDAARETKRRVQNPGHFNVLSDGSVVGIRRKVADEPDLSLQRGTYKEGLRKRFPAPSPARSALPEWEAWTVSPGGRVEADEVQPLFKENERTSHLLITDLGPKAKVGLMSMAFSFGNLIKVVTVGGQERFGSIGDPSQEGWAFTKRRRKAAIRGRAWSS